MTESLPVEVDLTITNEDEKAKVIITYDVRDEERRDVVRSICDEHGQWVQLSVFECNVSGEEYQELREKLLTAIDEEKDHICAYLLAQPVEETAAEWGIRRDVYRDKQELKRILLKAKDLDEEGRREIIQALQAR